MQCAVIGCSKQSTSESEDISFYPVPKDVKSKDKWMKIIDESKVTSDIRICPNHFTSNDFLASGKLRKRAVPEMVQACRICLVIGTKMYDMTDIDLNRAYEEVTGLVLWHACPQLPEQLCWECAHRLRSSYKFREKARRSHDLLTELANSHTYITVDNILTIDRLEHNLTSTLVQKHHLEDFAIDFDTIPDEKSSIYLEIDLKDEEDEIKSEEEEDIYLKEEINHSDEERSVSTELFNQDNVIAEPAEIEKEKQKLKRRKLKSETKEVSRKQKVSLDEHLFKITSLTADEQHWEIQKRQESAKFINARLKCTVCFKVFAEEDSRATHMIRHSDKSGSHECDICKLRFKTQRELKSHIAGHTKKFHCTACPYVTMSINAARNHEKYHKGTVYNCPHCGEMFDKVSTYMSHVRIKHPSEFVCELCGNSFLNEKGVAMHKKLKHRFDDITVPPDGPRCEPCDIRFQSAEALNKHLELSPKHRPADNKVQRPPRGPNRIRYPAEENNFVAGPINCEQCDEKLPNAKLYFLHFRREHPDKNRTNFPSGNRHRSKSMCEVCGKMFQSLALLLDHSHTHTTKKQFSCEQCHKKFQRKYRLVQHLKLHQDVRKTYACTECGKRLSTSSNLARHAFTHTGLKPFKCEMCGKSFKFSSQKREHIAYVHMKKPWPKRARGERRPVHTQETSDDDQQQMWPPCE